jgi:hypothetical protein
MGEKRNAWGNPKKKTHLYDLGLNGILMKQDRRTWTGLIWLKTGISDGLCRDETFMFHKMWGIPRKPEELLASKEGLHWVQLVVSYSCS